MILVRLFLHPGKKPLLDWQQNYPGSSPLQVCYPANPGIKEWCSSYGQPE